MPEKKNRPRRHDEQSAWNQIDYGRRLETKLDVPPTAWESMTRQQATDRLLALIALETWIKKPAEFFTRTPT